MTTLQSSTTGCNTKENKNNPFTEQNKHINIYIHKQMVYKFMFQVIYGQGIFNSAYHSAI